MAKQTPAQVVISVFKGVRATARVLHLTPGAVSKWRTDGGGCVPGRHHKTLIEAARASRKRLTTNMLTFGIGGDA